MKKYLVPILFVIFFSQGTQAKVPESLSDKNIKKLVIELHKQISTDLLSKGYTKNLNGMDVGYIKPGFVLEAGKSIHVSPVKNITNADYEWVNRLTENIGDITAQLLKESELFSSVTKGIESNHVDLRLDLFIRGVAGQKCIWGLDLFDTKTNQNLLSGFDMVSTSGSNTAMLVFFGVPAHSNPMEYITNKIPKKAMIFIGKTNPEFNNEISKKSPGRERFDKEFKPEPVPTTGEVDIKQVKNAVASMDDGGRKSSVPIQDNEKCDFDISQFFNGNSSKEAHSVWVCDEDGLQIKIQVFADGTGFSSEAGGLSWTKTGCRNMKYKSATVEGEISDVNGSGTSRAVTFKDHIGGLVHNASCTYQQLE